MTPLEFRDVRDGDQIPAHCMRGRGTDGPALLAWFCPSLTKDEADVLGRMAERQMVEISVASMRRFIEGNIEAVRADLAEKSDDNLVRMRAMSVRP